MKLEKSKPGENGKKAHSHAQHMWMMAVCCGLPIVGLLAIAALGINERLLVTLIALICPIGMGVMMFMMMRDKSGKGKDHACCQRGEAAPKTDDNVANADPTTETEAIDTAPRTQAGSFKA